MVREATRLDRLIEGRAVGPEDLTDEVGRLAVLARRVESLAPTPERMDPPRRQAVRADLVAAARARRAAGHRSAGGTRRALDVWRGLVRAGRTTAVSGLVLALMSGGALAIATDLALPGQPLYPLKLVVEEATTALEPSGVARGDQLLGQAAGRIEEAVRVLAVDPSGGGADQAVAAERAAVALDRAAELADEGAEEIFTTFARTADPADLEPLRRWTSRVTRQLDLLPLASGRAAAAVEQLRREIAEIVDRLAALVPACDPCSGLPGVPLDLPDSAPAAMGADVPRSGGAGGAATTPPARSVAPSGPGADVGGASPPEPAPADVPESGEADPAPSGSEASPDAPHAPPDAPTAPEPPALDGAVPLPTELGSALDPEGEAAEAVRTAVGGAGAVVVEPLVDALDALAGEAPSGEAQPADALPLEASAGDALGGR